MIEENGTGPIVVRRTLVGKRYTTEYGGREVEAQPVEEVVIEHPEATLIKKVGPEEWEEGPDKSIRMVIDIIPPDKQ